MLLDDSPLSIGVLSVGCLGFGFDTTAGVDVDVKPVIERVLRFGLNTSSPTPYIQLSDDSSFALPENSLRMAHRCVE